jgi:hypothetical protein
VTANTTWKWYRDESTYPPSEGYALSYALRGASVLNISGGQITDDGASRFTITVADEDTADVTAGTYTLVAYAAKDGERFEIGRWSVVVLADVSAATAGQLQSHPERMVTILEEEIEARVSGDGSAHAGLSIGTAAGGRQIEMIPLRELYQLLAQYRAQVRAERNRGRLPSIGIRFGSRR